MKTYEPLNFVGLRALGRVSLGLYKLLGSRSGSSVGILTYHRVVPRFPGVPFPDNSVTPSRLREQLSGLLDCGFTFWPLSKILEYRARGEAVPSQTLVVTFDDGYQAVYTDAWPVLREMRVPATVFLATGFLDGDSPFHFDPWGTTYQAFLPPEAYLPLTTTQCREMMHSGLVELGAHTHSHQDFRGHPDAFSADLQTCLRTLHERFGLSGRETFAYPWGKPHQGFTCDCLVTAAKTAGLACALTTESLLVDPCKDPFSWGRFNVFPWDSSATLAAKVSGWYSWAPRLRAKFYATFAPRRKARGLRDAEKGNHMHVSLLSADALTAEHVSLWAEWQQADADLRSPFLGPEFTRQVAAVRPGIEIALIEQDGKPVGFFPFQRIRPGIGIPVAGPLSDFHGVVARPGTTVDPVELLSGCRLKAWHFHHLVASQGPFRPYCYCESPSYYMDLSGGYEAFCAERSRSGSQVVRRTLQKSRKIGRELGPLRFVAHTHDPDVFETLVRWKMEHYRRINAINYLSQEWVRQFLLRLLDLEDDCFRGVLSALYCGERLIAVHLGIRSRNVLHSWFPTYDPELADYSPGAVLFLLLAQEAPGLGIRRIDLGRGEERFKLSLSSGAVSVTQGSVDLRMLERTVRRSSFRFFRWLRASRLRAPAKIAGSLVPSLRRWATFHE